MKKFFAVVALAMLSQMAFAGNGGEGGWTTDPEPYDPGHSRGNVWFHCGAMTVTNDLNLLVTDATGVRRSLPMRDAGGMFSKRYVTVDGQYILNARIGGPYITDARGTVLAYCSGGSSSSGSDASGGGTGGNFP